VATYRFGAFVLDTSTYSLSRGAERLDVAARQLDLLSYLVTRPAQLVTRDDLFRDLWPGVAVTDNALTQLVSDLRRTLDDAPAAPRYVETVARRGYRFVAPVDAIELSVRSPPPHRKDSLSRRRIWRCCGAFSTVA
jgi:DNA-binding winged helix-turn-helix (wHTH) protein